MATILVVEDDPDLVMLLALMLQEHGYTVRAAGTVERKEMPSPGRAKGIERPNPEWAP